MEDFEKKALEQSAHKTINWFSYVDDASIIWPHGQVKLTEFLNHLSGLHNNFGTIPHISTTVTLHSYLHMERNRQSVLKCWHLKYRCQGITWRKVYDI
jgi:hypothetical protein